MVNLSKDSVIYPVVIATDLHNINMAPATLTMGYIYEMNTFAFKPTATNLAVAIVTDQPSSASSARPRVA